MILQYRSNIHGDKKFSGIPIVFLHAFPMNLRMWEPQIEFLNNNHIKYVAINYPGFGQSPLPENSKNSARMEFYAEKIRETLRKLRLSKAIFVGLSMGGYVAFALYRKWPELFAGLVLANTRASADDETGRLRRIQMIDDLKKTEDPAPIFDQHMIKFFTSTTQRENQQLLKFTRQIMEASTIPGIIFALEAMAGRAAAFDLLAGMNFPVLLLAGASDELTTVADARKMLSILPRAKLEIIEDAAHLSNLEKPEIFNQHLLRYWQQINIHFSLE